MTRARWLVALGLLGAIAIAIGLSIGPPLPVSDTVEIDIHFSKYAPATIRVPTGVPVRFSLVNPDPIDHEWIVGDAAVHERHRSGTEPIHDARPTEITIPAGTSVDTVVTFDGPATLLFICHLPGHEAFGMVGTLIVSRG
jgi:uncharacterized cupredoxin-like copper-binding protein